MRVLIFFAAFLTLSSPLAAQGRNPSAPVDMQQFAAVMGQGTILFDAQNFAEAIPHFIRAMKLNPHDARPAYNLGYCEFNLAVQTGNQSRIEKAKDYVLIANKVDDSWGAPYFLWGIVGTHVRNYDAAVIGFNNALLRRFREKDSRANLAQSLFFLGVARAQAGGGSDDDIIAIFERALDMLEPLKDDESYLPDMRRNFRDLWLKCHNNLAAIRQRAIDLPKAEKHLKILMKAEPRNHEHPFNLGKVYGDSQRWDDAVIMYQKALDLWAANNPDNRNGWLEPHPFMGYISSQRDQMKEAEAHFALYLEFHPDSWDCLYRLADHYERVDRLEEAAQTFSRCIELDGSRMAAMYKLSSVMRLLKRIDEADQWLTLFKTLEKREKQRGRPQPRPGKMGVDARDEE